MNLTDACKSVLGQFAGFSGRARRSEFWWWYLLSATLPIIVYVLAAVLNSSIVAVLAVILSIVIILPTLAVSVRRLHDTGRSGWWYLIIFVPLVGGILLLVWWALDGEPGVNQYGPSPLSLATVGGPGAYGQPAYWP